MKTYQFVVLALIGAAIAGALVYKPKKKPCGCGGHGISTDTAVLDTTDTGG